MVGRTKIEETYEALRRRSDEGDYEAWVDLFAENCTFINSMLKEPIKGREALRALVAQWPKVVNRNEWVVIDGNRLAIGWNERQESMADDAPAYRGISTFVFDDDGLIASYEGMFDTAAVAAAVGASQSSSS